jgi:hypothetical protein
MNQLFGRVATVPTPTGATADNLRPYPTNEPSSKTQFGKVAKTEFRCGSLRWLVELLRPSLACETRQVIFSKTFLPSQL